MAEFDPFEREFRRRAAGLRRTPSPRSWNRIERQLGHEKQGGVLLALRPWMIAALVVLLAGIFTLAGLSDRGDDILAQRAETILELSDPYAPLEDFTPSDYEGGSEATERTRAFRDVVVAKPYRVAG